MVDVNRRAYRSPARAEAADRTRRAVVAAATALFVERGYSAASLRDIADVAGVARPTVAAAFGSKPALLRRVLDEALAGDDEPVPVAQRPWFAPVWEATTAAGALDAYAGVCTVIAQRAARLFEVVRRAAGDSPECAELWTTLAANRRAGAAMVARHAAGLGPLRADLDAERAVDALWVFNDPAHYDALVVQRGWSEAEFRAWLAEQMRAALLDPAPGLA